MVGFEKIKDAYESCSDFENIFTVLRDSLTHEVDDFLLQLFCQKRVLGRCKIFF